MEASGESVALVERAAKKAAIAWLRVPGAEPAYLVWCAWFGEALYVISGPGEQTAPGLAEATEATVSMRGDHGGRIVMWPAQVSTVEPDEDGEWAQITAQLAGKRLNSPGGSEQTVQRWAQQCVLSRLTPTGSLETMPDTSLAEPPRPTPAARLPRRPFHL